MPHQGWTGSCWAGVLAEIFLCKVEMDFVQSCGFGRDFCNSFVSRNTSMRILSSQTSWDLFVRVKKTISDVTLVLITFTLAIVKLFEACPTKDPMCHQVSRSSISTRLGALL